MAASETTKDVSHFRNLLSDETAKLTTICQVWEAKITKLDEVAGEDVCGRIRAAVGKARILMERKGRFPQFKQLIDNCEFGYGEKETTCMDLQGFWEMIFYQVEDIVKNFDKLSKLESNGWKDQIIKPVSKTKSVSRPKPKEVPIKRSASVELRAMMAAKRKEMTEKNKVVPSIIVEAPEPQAPIQSKTEERVFEGGFFRVTSPNPQRKSPIKDKTDGRHLEAAFESIHLTPYESTSQSKSASLPPSTHATPSKTEDRFRRSLLDSASRRLAVSTTNQTPFAIMRVSSACRRSMSRDNTPAGDLERAELNNEEDFKMTLNFDEKENDEGGKIVDGPLRRSARLKALKEHN